MNYGIKVSKTGYSIDDTDEHMAFTSKYPSQKVYAQGTAIVNANALSSTITVAHDLDYVPQFIVCNDTLGTVVPGFVFDDGLGFAVYFDAKMSKSLLTICVESGTIPNKQYNFKYLILVDSL